MAAASAEDSTEVGRGRAVDAVKRGLGLAGPAEKAEPKCDDAFAGRTGLTSMGTMDVVAGGTVAAEEEGSPPLRKRDRVWPE